MDQHILLVQQKISYLIHHGTQGLYEREIPVRLMILAALAGESAFLLGPPGVGKSLIARRVKHLFQDAQSFEYLMGKFSTPDELFGPLSIEKLTKEDTYLRMVDGFLPTAHVVFLDEVWNASPPIQNALLTVLNEKKFRNGAIEIPLPMVLFVGASNSLHTQEDTKAFWDRFLLRIPIEPIKSLELFEKMILDQEDPSFDPIPQDKKLTLKELETFRNNLGFISVHPQVVKLLGKIRTSFLERGKSSDRRWKKILNLLKASALSHGRTQVLIQDCYIMPFCLWDEPGEVEELTETLSKEIASVLDAIPETSNQPPVETSQISTLSDVKSQIQQAHHQLNELFHRLEKNLPKSQKPQIFDGEYVYLDILETQESDGLRIWKPDLDQLSQGDVDCFVYRQGSYLITQKASVEPWKEPFTYQITWLEESTDLLNLPHKIIARMRTEESSNTIKELDQLPSVFSCLSFEEQANWQPLLTDMLHQIQTDKSLLEQWYQELISGWNQFLWIPIQKELDRITSPQKYMEQYITLETIISKCLDQSTKSS